MITQEWLAERATYRAELFGVDIEDSSCLATICRQSPSGGHNSKSLLPLDQRAAITGNILHTFVSLGGEQTEQFITHADRLSTIQCMSANVIAMWERACLVSRVEFPLVRTPMQQLTKGDFQRKDIRMVVETAAAVDENIGYLENRGKQAEEALTRLTARYGPTFARDWLSGQVANRIDSRLHLHAGILHELAVRRKDVISATRVLTGKLDQINHAKVAEALNMDLELAKAVFTPTLILKYGLKARPLERLGVTWRKVQKLTPGFLARRFEAPLSAVEGFFSQSYLVTIVTDYPKTYLDKLESVFTNAKVHLTTEALAETLGASPQIVDEVLSTRLRNLCAREEDAVGVIRMVFKRAVRAWQQTGLSVRTLANLAFSQRARFEELIPKLVAAHQSPPPKVKSNVWVTAIARFPDDPARQRAAALAYSHYMNIIRPGYLSAPIWEDNTTTQQIIVPDYSLSPEEILFSENDPQQLLVDLAEKAGIEQSKLAELLDAFSAAQESALEPTLIEIIERLQTVAASEGL